MSRLNSWYAYPNHFNNKILFFSIKIFFGLKFSEFTYRLLEFKKYFNLDISDIFGISTSFENGVNFRSNSIFRIFDNLRTFENFHKLRAQKFLNIFELKNFSKFFKFQNFINSILTVHVTFALHQAEMHHLLIINEVKVAQATSRGV